MDDHGTYLGIVDPDTGRRRVEAHPAGTPVYAIDGVAWGWEGDTPRALAHALLLDLTGHAPLGEMAWDLTRELLADDVRFASNGGWELSAAEAEEPVDLERVGLAIAALRLGDDPQIATRWHAAAPEGPGPWYWAAQLAAVGQTDGVAAPTAPRAA